jgi:cystathionine beta-lyase/cystathionine gamma-synthase
MQAHERGAQAVAKMLNEHPTVERVYYPGLPSHPHHELAKRQQQGFGGMVSFDVRGGRADVERVLYGTKLFQLAESLGGIESLMAFPVTMSHASMSAEARRQAGITEQTIRLSVGIEHPDDLIADLRQALGS